MENRNKHNISLVLIQNANDLEQEITWFAQILDVRFKLYFGQDCEFESIDAIQPPNLSHSSSPYASCIQQNDLDAFERIALILAFSVHDNFITY